MKIKEKGLTGKAANTRKDLMSRSRGFDAFREMARAKGGSSKPSGEKSSEPKKDVFLDFMGTKLLIDQDEEGNGSVKEEDVPFIKGATLKFDGCGGDVQWSEIKVRLMFNGLQAGRSTSFSGSDQGKV
jgi:lupus La protein